MARPRDDANHERMTARILESARKLIRRDGFDKLSLRGVARDIGHSPAGLYEFFAGKDALVLALAHNAEQQLGSALRSAAAGDVDGCEPSDPELVRLGCAYIAFARRQPEDFLLLFSRMVSGRQALGERIPASSPYGLVVDATQRAVQQGTVHVTPSYGAEYVAYGLWSLAHGAAMLQLSHLDGFEADFPAADRENLLRFVRGLAR